MALKDGAGLVKKFAMIDIQRYQNVAVGDTVADTQKAYEALLATNGVVAEGVSSAPQSVTKQQTINLMRGKTGAAVLAKHFGCGLTMCDVGVNADIYESTVLNRKIAYARKISAPAPR